MKQLTIDDVIGTFDYRAESTAKQFLAKKQETPTYAVDFYKNQKQILDWFEVNSPIEAEDVAKGKHGPQIQIVRTYKSDKSLKEIMAMD